MPLPNPHSGETRSDFIERCMGSLAGEFPDADQRLAVCFQQLESNEDDMPKQNAMNFSNGDQIRANIRCTVNGSKVRRETINGRDTIIVPSFTLPDDVVMNGIKYPAEEIAKSYMTLEESPAPLGHPEVDGMFVSARSPLGLNLGYFGAWNANVEQRDGRVYLEKMIDVERASESEMGRRVLEAIDKGDPIHTSTGLLLNLRESSEDDAEYIGYNMEFDHDAILLDGPGAATPEQGVGMLVNKAKGGNGQKIAVVNSSVDYLDDMIDYHGMELLSAMERRETASRWGRIKETIMEALSLGRDSESKPEEIEMADATKEGLDEIVARVEKMEASINGLLETVQTISNTVSAAAETVETLNADRKAKHEALINKAVEAELLTEDDARATPAVVLEKLMGNSEVKPAPGIHGGFTKPSEKVSLAEDWE
jgi:hypothetical protein